MLLKSRRAILSSFGRTSIRYSQYIAADSVQPLRLFFLLLRLAVTNNLACMNYTITPYCLLISLLINNMIYLITLRNKKIPSKKYELQQSNRVEDHHHLIIGPKT
ncbi:hypothetical protein BX666DRAFT_1600399 [Dichotomocladium elegans]|nr:hypothetical protein BX666DRAFT_1600399 [Dichotomocladium elegans]